MHIAAVIEDPGAANSLVGLTEALAEKGIELRIYATDAAFDYAPTLELSVIDLSALKLPFSERDRPAAILVGTSENPESPVFGITAAALNAGIPCFGLIDGPANAVHRFRGTGSDPLAHAPDYLLVMDPVAKDAYVDLGFDTARIDIVGHPAMDRVRARQTSLETEGRANIRARRFPGVVADRCLVLFLAEKSDGVDPQDFRRSSAYTLNGRGGRDDRTEICLEETIDALADLAPDAALAVRLHPKNQPDTFVPYAPELDAITSGGDPLEDVFAADLVIGLTSVLLFEAAVMGRPTISVTPRKLEAGWLSSIGLGLTRHVCTSGDLRASIAEALGSGLKGQRNPDDVVLAGAAARMADAICCRIEV